MIAVKHERKPNPPKRGSLAGDELTDRELEILTILTNTGYTNRELGKTLNLSPATIRTHMERIFEKLEVETRVEAVVEGIRRKLVEI
jgi:two-component system nitrate/nitrite response regulator NarL